MTATNENVPESEETAEETVVEADPLEMLGAERDRIKDQLLRTAADFDNFRKRTRRDLEEAAARAREDLLRELLPIIDNLERAVAASKNATEVAAVADGVAMVLKQFDDVSGRVGIERVKAIGERFDPQVHDAVQQMESSEHDAGTIVAEVAPGYAIDGRLVRPAMVVVARPPAAAPEDAPEDAPEEEAEPAEEAAEAAEEEET